METTMAINPKWTVPPGIEFELSNSLKANIHNLYNGLKLRHHMN